MDHSLPGLIWVLTRLQLQNEALIALLGKERPGLKKRMEEELENLQESPRAAEVYAEKKREIEQAADGIWLLQQGISDISPPPETP
ncbi:MAG TPA: hypothetical protein VJU54_08160 [Nitrospiraceae bacterium]|nr:hypothetical protein [Nitrospiraceae bacterium]